MKDAAERVDIYYQQSVRKMQEEFSNTTHIAICMVDSAGMPITEMTGYSNLYHVIRKTEAGAQQSNNSLRQLYTASRLSKRTIMGTCPYTGLLQAIIPLVVNHEFRGGWLIGHIRQPEEERTFAFYDVYLRGISSNIKVHLYPLRKMLLELPEMRYSDFLHACMRLEALTSSNLQYEYNRSMNLRMQMSS